MLTGTQTGGITARSPSAFYHARRARSTPLRRLLHPVVPFRFRPPADGALTENLAPPLDLYGPVIKEHVPVVPSKSLASLCAALDKRCNYRTDARCSPIIVQASIDLLHRIAPQPLAPLEWSWDAFEEWNAQFDAPKRARQALAARNIAEITTKDFSDKQVFVKMEALLKRHDPNWAPRIINQSSDLHNALLGPIMQSCTKRMFKAMDQDRSPKTLQLMGAYKKTSEEIVAHMHLGGSNDSKFVSTDFSANDSSQVKDVHMLEVMWLRHFGAPLWVTSLMLVANSYTIGNRTYRIKMRINNQLPTGSQSTTFRNSMWNASILAAFMTKIDRSGSACILGDDCVVRIDGAKGSQRFYTRTYDFVAKLAQMQVKVKVRSTLEGIPFLSRHFTMTPSGYVMVPFLGKAIARFNVCPIPKAKPALYLAGKALSYAYEFRNFRAIAKLFVAKFAKLWDGGDLDRDGISWNVRGLFLRLGVEGILAEVSNPSSIGDLSDFNRLTMQWGLTATDYYMAVIHTLFSDEDLSIDGLAFLSLEWL